MTATENVESTLVPVVIYVNTINLDNEHDMPLKTTATSAEALLHWVKSTVDTEGRYVLCTKSFHVLNDATFKGFQRRRGETGAVLELYLRQKKGECQNLPTVGEVYKDPNRLRCAEWCEENLPSDEDIVVEPKMIATADNEATSRASSAKSISRTVAVQMPSPRNVDGTPGFVAPEDNPLIFRRAAPYSQEDWSTFRVRGRELVSLLKRGEITQGLKLADRRLDATAFDAETGDTCLILAGAAGAHHLCTQLIGWRADVNARNNAQQTALIRAAEKNQYGVINALLAADGVDPCACDETGQSALSWAARRDDFMCRALCRAKADIDSQDVEGFTPLHRACFTGRKDCVEVLVKNGASLNLCCRGRRTALQVAITLGHSEICSYLIQHGGTE